MTSGEKLFFLCEMPGVTGNFFTGFFLRFTEYICLRDRSLRTFISLNLKSFFKIRRIKP